MRFFRPTWYELSLKQVNFDALKEMGVETILCDLDNTLTAYYEKVPSKAVAKLVQKIQKKGFKLIIISNNHLDRVSIFCESLKLPYLSSAHKPFINNAKNYLITNNIDFKKCVIIGDQLITDVMFANSLGIRSILVEPVADSDLPVTRINRAIDKAIRNNNLRRNKYKKLGEKK
ncbi:MAG: YqeG family HAD IIIA-type phosphatase [Bacilli bacterium]|nr:YqeG family HAD IIIA-type phosphatase [Bacilli bacterium]MDD3422004.1 YqeG family HAD IIIA-type phosphatase [Bacilli bacterium]MDD4066030.1 YqeG family HAD IIIA-type phosphatase [Bacilli bacterium]